MNFASVEKIARAILYEGYILYPYRPSSTKNRQRWNFGTLYPRQWAEAQKPVEPFRMVTECLVTANVQTEISIRVHCLQFLPSEQGWERGIERKADAIVPVLPLCESPFSVNLKFEETEKLEAEEIDRLQPLTARLSISAKALTDSLLQLHLELTNLTLASSDFARNRALLQSMISAYLLLGIKHGEFISLLDPPEAAAEVARACQNVGAFPVLVGEEGDRSMMLSSPIILYDYPQIAPESTGDFFDGTEMDEMLALRVMTLTDEEKAAMRQSDEQARKILERTDNLPAEHWMKVHGAIRGMRRVPEDEAKGDL